MRLNGGCCLLDQHTQSFCIKGNVTAALAIVGCELSDERRIREAQDTIDIMKTDAEGPFFVGGKERLIKNTNDLQPPQPDSSSFIEADTS